MSRRLLALALAAVLALAMLIPAFGVAELHDHDCDGGDCPICHVIDQAQAMLSSSATTASGVTAAAAAFALIIAVRALRTLHRTADTPVTRADMLLV